MNVLSCWLARFLSRLRPGASTLFTCESLLNYLTNLTYHLLGQLIMFFISTNLAFICARSVHSLSLAHGSNPPSTQGHCYIVLRARSFIVHYDGIWLCVCLPYMTIVYPHCALYICIKTMCSFAALYTHNLHTICGL